MFPYPLMAPVSTKPTAVVELLEPAIDGPPSPGSIRAISNQMHRASLMDRQHSRQSYQTTSSGSSLRSQNSMERPSWDRSSDTASASLSRQSSGRSSSGQLRERHDSVQIFGRSLFNKRAKLHHESVQTPFTGSPRSVEFSLDKSGSVTPPPQPPKTSHGLPMSSTFSLVEAAFARDSSKSSFFSRRRIARSNMLTDDSESRRKVQISGPYNFHHVTHTNKEEVPDLKRGSRMIIPADFAMAPPSTGSVSAAPVRPRALTHTRSQDQLRLPPPRPPRSPVESSFASPVPPPRLSSRASIRYGDFEPTTRTERPRTRSTPRTPASYSILPEMPSRPIHSHSFSADMNMNGRMSQAQMMPFVPARPAASPEDNNWPLVCSAMASSATAVGTLPGVPEEEEHANNQNSMHKSHVSVASNSPSLRGSHSLPVMCRPPSNASETLGRFDLMAVQQALHETMSDTDSITFLSGDWEDAIDYCYEHAVEADCDYAWERPSLDVSRESILEEMQGSSTASSTTQKDHSEDTMSNAALNPANFDVPFLSPASQTSIASMMEATTPTGLAMRKPGLTIETGPAEEMRPSLFGHARSSSRASSFKESHGFNLSPTFFIPGSDRYEQCLVPPVRSSFAISADEDDDDGFPLGMNRSGYFISARTSASTTGSRESRESMLSDRHISATSTATDLTRLTMSTNSIEDLKAKPEIEIQNMI